MMLSYERELRAPSGSPEEGDTEEVAQLSEHQDPNEGTQDPEAGDTAPPEGKTEPSVEQLLQEQKKLRDQLREERATRLVEKHGISSDEEGGKALVNLIKDVPRDQQEGEAAKLIESLKATFGQPPAAGGEGPKPEGEKADGDGEPASDEKEPANKAELEAVTKSGPEGGEPPKPPTEPNDMLELIKGTKNMAELEQAQAQAKAARRG